MNKNVRQLVEQSDIISYMGQGSYTSTAPIGHRFFPQPVPAIQPAAPEPSASSARKTLIQHELNSIAIKLNSEQLIAEA